MSKKAESRLQLKIQRALKAEYGADLWLFKVHGSEYQPAGVPDLVGVVRGRFFALEVKTPIGELSKIQITTLKRLTRAGAITGVPTTVDEARWIISAGLAHELPF